MVSLGEKKKRIFKGKFEGSVLKCDGGTVDTQHKSLSI